MRSGRWLLPGAAIKFANQSVAVNKSNPGDYQFNPLNESRLFLASTWASFSAKFGRFLPSLTLFLENMVP